MFWIWYPLIWFAISLALIFWSWFVCTFVIQITSIYKSWLMNFSTQAWKLKKSILKKFRLFSQQKFLIFLEMELSSSKIKTLLYFSQKMFFLYFGSWNFLVPSLKNSNIFSEKSLSYISWVIRKVKEQSFSSYFSKKVIPTFRDNCRTNFKIKKSSHSRMTAD